MSALYVDSSYDITLGLLDDNLGWLDLRTFKGQRASSTLQTETHRLLKDHKQKMSELSSVISVAGPGFYTGLRLSEGFSDVTSFFGIPHFSFYSYEIPNWLGSENGTWLTKAYRGEYFVYQWSGSKGETKLLTAKELENYSPVGQVFIHSETSLDEKLKNLTAEAVSTNDLLKKSPEKVFRKICSENLVRDSYYFRAPEDEFRMNP